MKNRFSLRVSLYYRVYFKMSQSAFKCLTGIKIISPLLTPYGSQAKTALSLDCYCLSYSCNKYGRIVLFWTDCFLRIAIIKKIFEDTPLLIHYKSFTWQAFVRLQLKKLWNWFCRCSFGTIGHQYIKWLKTALNRYHKVFSPNFILLVCLPLNNSWND